jgi:signal transduction histidine kinase
VIVANLDTEPFWANSAFGLLMTAHGLRSCWSTPIYATTGQVLGTLAILQARQATPTPPQEDLIARLTQVTSIAVERALTEAALDMADAEFARILGIMAIGVSVASEMTQPLSGVVINASTGLRMLTATPPDLERMRETLRRTLRDCDRAAEMVTRLRGVLRSTTTAGSAGWRQRVAPLNGA